jgi:hypothetical protein
LGCYEGSEEFAVSLQKLFIRIVRWWH